MMGKCGNAVGNKSSGGGANNLSLRLIAGQTRIYIVDEKAHLKIEENVRCHSLITVSNYTPHPYSIS